MKLPAPRRRLADLDSGRHALAPRAARALIAGLGLAALLSGCAESAPPPQPNVLIWLVDTLRADHLGCYGYGRPTSPHLDALAARGVLFADAHVHSNWTQPSVASLLSGRNPIPFSGRFSSPVPEGLTLAAESFGESGYATAGFTVTVATAARYGFARGFDTYEELDLLLDPVERKKRAAEVHGADKLVDAAVRWIDRWAARRRGGEARPSGAAGVGRPGLPAEAPFFLFLHSVDPHAPFGDRETEDSFAAPYDGPVNGSVDFLGWAQRNGHEWTAADRQYIIDRYDDDVRFNDAQLGRLVAHLAAQDLLDDTLIVVVSDHGEEFWDHHEPGPAHGHANLHRELTHVPLVLHWPAGLPSGLRVEGLLRGVDLLPTLLELSGLPAPAVTDGASVAPALLGREPAAGAAARREGSTLTLRREVLLFADRAKPEHEPLLAVRSGRVLVKRGGDADAAFFDLTADPREQHDLAPDRSADVTRWLALLAEWEAERARMLEQLSGRGEVETDAQAVQQLQALGYLGDEEN